MIDAVLKVIDRHVPSITDADDDEIVYAAYWGKDLADAADLAVRTCACGERIDGFYEYVAHLKERIRQEVTT